MGDVVAKVWTGSNGHKYSGKDEWVLMVAISRSGWGSRADFLARYRRQELPGGASAWSGEVAFLDEPAVGRQVRLETPFGVLEPIYPLYTRTLGMPKIIRP